MLVKSLIINEFHLLKQIGEMVLLFVVGKIMQNIDIQYLEFAYSQKATKNYHLCFCGLLGGNFCLSIHFQ